PSQAPGQPPSEPPRQAAADPDPASRAGVYIQVMATRDAAAATAIRSRLSAKGYPVGISSGSGADATLRRVKVGPYAGRAEAEKVARKLRSEEGLRTWIQ